VFQFHHLLPAFSALENVTLPALMAEGRVSSAQRDRHARSLLAAVGLARPWTSARRAVGRHAAARGHCPRAGHEPAAGAGRRAHRQPGHRFVCEVFALLRRMHAERGTSFVVVTHDPRLAARCDRLVELTSGSSAGAVSVKVAASDHAVEL
jgi:lipoprotein-releasing system ATP-binding protein